MTGRYPNVTGVIRNAVKLSPDETCIAEVFRDNGYSTQYFGKWHLNGPSPKPLIDPGWVPPEDRQGFQKWTAFNFAHTYYGSQYYKNNDPTLRQVPIDQYEPDWQTQQAINFITARKNQKFFVFLSIGTPHEETYLTPGDLPPGGDYTFPYDPNTLTLRPNVDYPDPLYSRQEYADYYGIVSNFDWNVGRILSALDDLGIAENTIVVVSSDHGDLLGSHFDEYNHFRAKSRFEVESLDIPFILRYPKKVAPNVFNEVITSVDVMPTLLGLCRLPIPSGVMGRDFSPLLEVGRAPNPPPYGEIPSTEAILAGMWDDKGWVGVRTPEYALSCDKATLTPAKLFHNTLDPFQMNNVVNNPDYQSIRDELHQILVAWMDYVGSGH
jgi:arylsulfatase A-like enzyme